MLRLHSILLVLLLLVPGAVRRAAAAPPLTNQSFNFVLQGDDPGTVFAFDLTENPLVPLVVDFNGLFQNLDGQETGVRWELYWPVLGGGDYQSSPGAEFVRLPGAGQLPVSLSQSIGFTPDTVFLHVEGGGPSDHFQFTGNLTIAPVPEPGVLTLLGAGAVLGLWWRRRR